MSDYGIKISQEGYSVSDGDNRMILTSRYPFLKAHSQGAVSLNITGAGTFTTFISHNLGYHPVYNFFGEVLPSTPNDRYPGHIAAVALGYVQSGSYVTTSRLYLGWTDTSAGLFAAFPYTVYFYYYLFYDSLT